MWLAIVNGGGKNTSSCAIKTKVKKKREFIKMRRSIFSYSDFG